MHNMRSNPEAIVNNRALNRREHDSGHYEDTQQDVYREDDGDANVPEEEDAEWLQQERRRRRREETRQQAGQIEDRNPPLGAAQQRIMDALPPLPDDSDQEELYDSGYAAGLKRRSLEAERKRRREEKEEKERKRRLKRFPVIPKDVEVVPVFSPTSNRHSQTREPEVRSLFMTK